MDREKAVSGYLVEQFLTLCRNRFFYVIGDYFVIFLLHKKRSAKDAHLAELKLAASDTARARKSPASGLFVL